MSRPEVTSGQQSRVKREYKTTAALQDLTRDRKKVETSNSYKHRKSLWFNLQVKWGRGCTNKRLELSGLQGQIAERSTTLWHTFFSQYSYDSWLKHWNFKNLSQMNCTIVLFCPFLIKNKQTNPSKCTQSSLTVLQAAAIFRGIKAMQRDKGNVLTT